LLKNCAPTYLDKKENCKFSIGWYVKIFPKITSGEKDKSVFPRDFGVVAPSFVIKKSLFLFELNVAFGLIENLSEIRIAASISKPSL
jgi:hypothetical protein